MWESTHEYQNNKTSETPNEGFFKNDILSTSVTFFKRHFNCKKKLLNDFPTITWYSPLYFSKQKNRVGGFNQPNRKICSSKLGITSPKKIFETTTYKLVPYRLFLMELLARKKTLTFHYTGCLTRILIVVYETIPTWPGSMLSPKIPPNNQGPFFHCYILVSGFNPFEKYVSKWESSRNAGENKKMKPPASIGLWSTPCLLCLPCPTSPEVAIASGAEVPAATKSAGLAPGEPSKNQVVKMKIGLKSDQEKMLHI